MRGEIIPIFKISELFSIEEAQINPESSIMVLVEDSNKKIAIMVDELMGKQQTVIKNLGEGLGKIPGVSGGAIMPSGNVNLILDIAGIIGIVENKSSELQNNIQDLQPS